MADLKPLRKVIGDHDYSFNDSSSNRRRARRITQVAFYRGGDVVIAIGELNHPNLWNDAAFDAACAHMQKAWNQYLKTQAGSNG